MIAPDSFKESLTAPQVASCIEDGFREVYPEWRYVRAPMADGGEGTVEAIIAAAGGQLLSVTVTGPEGAPVDAVFGMLDDGRTAVIEMAAASGLTLVSPDARDPWRATSYGVGELILGALALGARRLIVGIGGSATNDGGAGMLQALGVRLIDHAGEEIGRGGGGLAELDRIDHTKLDPRLVGCEIDIACDVDNPLLGPFGASAIFGPQKGATHEMVGRLELALSHYAEIIERDCGRAVGSLPCGGAAGGLGAGMMAFLDARPRPGVEIVGEAIGLDALVADADLVITGEGRMDAQSAYGKAPAGVATVARRNGKPVIAIVGSIGSGAEAMHAHGVGAMVAAIGKVCSRDEALAEAADNVRRAARNVAATLKIGRNLQDLESSGQPQMMGSNDIKLGAELCGTTPRASSTSIKDEV